METLPTHNSPCFAFTTRPVSIQPATVTTGVVQAGGSDWGFHTRHTPRHPLHPKVQGGFGDHGCLPMCQGRLKRTSLRNGSGNNHRLLTGEGQLLLQGIIHPHTHNSFRDFELSLQSPLHPSIALLVLYRSHHGYSALAGKHLPVRTPLARSPTRALQGFIETRGHSTFVGLQHGAVTLDSRSIPDTFASLGPHRSPLNTSHSTHPASQRGRAAPQVPPRGEGLAAFGMGLRHWCVLPLHSPLLAIAVAFFSSAD